MKNIFKFMGVALLACSMIMVSCKKDDENSTDNGGGNNGGSSNGYTLKWKGSAPTLNYAEGKEYGGLALFEAAAAINGEDITFPYFGLYTCLTTSGVYYITDIVKDENGNYLSDQYESSVWESNNEEFTFYNFNGDYQTMSFTFDATSNTMTGSLSVIMWDYDDLDTALDAYCEENNLNWDEMSSEEKSQAAQAVVAQHPEYQGILDIAFNNFTFTAIQ